MKTALRVIAAVVVLAVAGGAVFYLHPLWVADQMLRFRLWRAGVHSEYALVDGYRIHYLEAPPLNDVGGVPVVLVHGLGARSEEWAGLIPALAAQGFHVYAPDLLGYGRSPRPDVSYSISMEEEMVVEFMRAMKLARVGLGGWSMGGWIATKLALDHPEMVDRLMVYDSAGIYFPATFGPELFTPADTAGVRRLMQTLSPKPLAMPEFAARDALRKLQGNAWVLKRSTAAMMTGRDLLDFRLQELKQPMLIVWGEKDELIPLASGEKMHDAVAQSVLSVVEGCGHLAPAECSGPVAESTVRFLKAEPAMPRGMMRFPAQ